MIRFGTVIAALAVAGLSGSAAATPLWQNVESGMTAAQIKRSQPSAQTSDNPDPLGNGATCDLTIPALAIGTDEYRVCFFMLHGRLVEVMLTAKNPNEAMFRETINLLRSKYGPELGAGEPLCKPGVMTMCEASWALKSGVNVDAVFDRMEGYDPNPVFNIVYQTRIAADASKL